MIPRTASRCLSHSGHNVFPKFWVTLSKLLLCRVTAASLIQVRRSRSCAGVRTMQPTVRIPPLVRITLVAALKSGPQSRIINFIRRDADAPCRVLDDGQGVGLSPAGQVGAEEVACQDRVGR